MTTRLLSTPQSRWFDVATTAPCSVHISLHLQDSFIFLDSLALSSTSSSFSFSLRTHFAPTPVHLCPISLPHHHNPLVIRIRHSPRVAEGTTLHHSISLLCHPKATFNSFPQHHVGFHVVASSMTKILSQRVCRRCLHRPPPSSTKVECKRRGRRNVSRPTTLGEGTALL